MRPLEVAEEATDFTKFFPDLEEAGLHQALDDCTWEVWLELAEDLGMR